jgi:hypothetical protein
MVDTLSVPQGYKYFYFHIGDIRGKLSNKDYALEGKKGILSIHDVTMEEI